jgi:hypothetical protein
LDVLAQALKALPTIASSPLAFIGYTLVVAAWLLAYARTKRFGLLMSKIKQVPTADRADIIRNEFNTVLPSSIDAEQWLRAQRQKYFLVAFVVSVISATSIIGFSIAAGVNGGTFLRGETKIPPDRLLSASPFRVRLEDCAMTTCNVTVFARGWDSQSRLRYDNKEQFNGLSTGQYRDSVLNSAERMYFQPNERIVFMVYCRLGSGPVLVGEQAGLDWKAWHEEGIPGYAAWLSCGDSNFKVGLGIEVVIAGLRINEPAVKDLSGPPS